MTFSLTQSSPQKIVLYSAGLLFLILAGITVLMWGKNGASTPERDARIRVREMVRAFNDKELEESAAHCASQVTLTLNGDRSELTRSEVQSRLEGAHKQFAYLNVRIQETKAEMLRPDFCLVSMDFHWTVAHKLYPGARRTSESINDGQHDTVHFLMELRDGKWFVTEIDLTLR